MEKRTNRIIGLAFAGMCALTMQSAIAASPVKVGGLAQLDYASFQGDAGIESNGAAANTFPDAFNSSAEFDKVEFYFKGELDRCWSFQVKWDADASRLEDTWVGFAGFEPVWVAAGRFKIPYGLENWGSSSALTFADLASVEAFAPGDGLGLYLEGSYHNVMGYAMSLTLPDTGVAGLSSSDPLTASGRVTFTPNWVDGALLHFGASYYHRNADRTQTLGVSSTPEVTVRNTPTLVASVTSTAGATNVYDGNHAWGLEFASQVGSLLFQSEFQRYSVDGENAEDLDFDGWYASLSYVLTGESRTYDQPSGTIGRLNPASDYGAWEVGLRYSDLDLSETGVAWTANTKRGEMKNWTLGLNWYANDNVRLTWNYIRARADYSTAGQADRDLNIFSMRGQLRF